MLANRNFSRHEASVLERIQRIIQGQGVRVPRKKDGYKDKKSIKSTDEKTRINKGVVQTISRNAPGEHAPLVVVCDGEFLGSTRTILSDIPCAKIVAVNYYQEHASSMKQMSKKDNIPVAIIHGDVFEVIRLMGVEGMINKSTTIFADVMNVNLKPYQTEVLKVLPVQNFWVTLSARGNKTANVSERDAETHGSPSMKRADDIAKGTETRVEWVRDYTKRGSNTKMYALGMVTKHNARAYKTVRNRINFDRWKLESRNGQHVKLSPTACMKGNNVWKCTFGVDEITEIKKGVYEIRG